MSARRLHQCYHVPGHRYNRLKYGMSGRSMQKINHIIVSIVSFLHVAPKGVKEVRRHKVTWAVSAAVQAV
jgi:hypothetical protein